MRARSTPKSRSGNTTPPLRDVDLLESDQFLPTGELDELWEWFYNAVNDNIDPELIFVKVINSARNPYRHHIPAGYKPNTAGQDLISLEHEDEVEQLNNLVNSLRIEVASKNQLISSLEASNRESEKQWAKELADKEKELEKREEQLNALRQKENEFDAVLADRDERATREKQSLEETANRQKDEIAALVEKREELLTLLQNLAKEQLHNAELYREALQNKHCDLERQQEQGTLQDEKLKQLEEQLAEYERRLADKEKEIDSKQTSLDELHLLIEGHDEIVAQRISECDTKHMESRRELIATVIKGLSKKSLTPNSIGLYDEEWTNQSLPSHPTPQRGWTWRS